ncbi:MAG: efflux RND transporter periplasmic adaptor subunit [Phycisphaerae bacterium]|nr:efflux RND transporter periplasmic adaptor subunit [Phycisphaerae bacterium]
MPDSPRLTTIRRLRCGAFIAAMAGVCLTGAGGCGKGGNASTAPAPLAAVEVTLTKAVSKPLQRTIRVSGTLRGVEETTVAAKVPGRVVSIARDLGDAALPGDELLRVDPIDYSLARDERMRAFREALAKIGLEALPDETFDVASVPSVQRARLQAENAQNRYDRGRQLAERTPPLISEQDFADLKTTWDVAERDVEGERLTAEAVIAEARTLDVQVQIAEQRLADTTLRAPNAIVDDDAPADSNDVRYHVAERLVSVGDFVQMATPLMRLVDRDPVKLRAFVQERRVGAVMPGQRAAVALEGFANPFTGTVARVSPSVDPQTRAFAIEILVANPDGTLKPGSFGTADVYVGEDEGLIVRAASIVTFAGVHKVLFVVDGKVVERRIEIGAAVGDSVEVRKGLAADDEFIEKPTSAMNTGTPVRVVPAATADPDLADIGSGS